MSEDVYYFAYGSNLNPERMNIRQAYFKERKLGKLLDFEFVLNKRRLNGTAAANIQSKTGETVYGALYTCTMKTIERLDYFECVHKNEYYRAYVNVILQDNSSIKALTYMGCEDACDNNISTVNKDYLEHILCGRDILPLYYISFLESFMTWAVNSCSLDEITMLEAAGQTEE